MNPHISIERCDHQGAALIEVRGEIDLATAPALEEALTAAQSDGVRIVDLTGVTFIDSTGLRALLAAHSKAGGSLKLIVADGPVTKLFEITGVNQVFDLAATRDEATAVT